MHRGTVSYNGGQLRQVVLFQFPHPSYNLPPRDAVDAFQDVSSRLTFERYTGCSFPRQCAAGHKIGII
jgi:hypothetical protein